MKVNMRDNLRCSRAIVLHDVVVTHAGYAGYCAREEGEPETFVDLEGTIWKRGHMGNGWGWGEKGDLTDFSRLESLHVCEFDFMLACRYQ